MRNRLLPGPLALAAAVATACATAEAVDPKPVPAGSEPALVELDRLIVRGSAGAVGDRDGTFGEWLDRVRRDMEGSVRTARPLPGDVLAFEESGEWTKAPPAKTVSRCGGPDWLETGPPADGAARLAAAAFPCGLVRFGAAARWTRRNGTRPRHPSFPAVAK